MYLSSYQTTAGSAFYKTDIVNHLRTARAEKQLTLLLPDVARLYAITQVNANTKTIPAFEHPVRVEESTGDYWVIDLRPYASKSRPVTVSCLMRVRCVYWSTVR
jgi:hypothetical protein